VIWPAFTILAGLATGAAVLLVLARGDLEEPGAAPEASPEPERTAADAQGSD